MTQVRKEGKDAVGSWQLRAMNCCIGLYFVSVPIRKHTSLEDFWFAKETYLYTVKTSFFKSFFCWCFRPMQSWKRDTVRFRDTQTGR